MIRTTDLYRDRLYLSQEDQSVYIDTCKIPPHHVEGIRFLYRQWKRKKPGVIINDPFSFGRNIPIVLFLQAILRFLEKPVLVLCQAGTEHAWEDRFNTWTDLLADVTIESRNPMIRKKILVNTMVNLPEFCRRDWSILIVDGDKYLSASQVLKLPFRADFKIWNTPTNMKENLDKFAELYKWLHPSEIFEKYYFIPNEENAVDVIEKSILLDSFMEDIVIRRADFDSSFETYHKDTDPPQTTTVSKTNTSIPPPPIPKINFEILRQDCVKPTTVSNTNFEITLPQSTAVSNTNVEMLPPQAAVPTPYVSKKNKDATGTKIKRSKRKPEEQENRVSAPPTAAPAQPIGETSKSPETTDITEDFSIENYKRKIRKDNQELLDKQTESHSTQIINIDDCDNQSNLKLCEIAKDNLVEMDTIVFANDLLIRKVKTKGDKAPTCDKKEIATEFAKVLVLEPSSEPTNSKSIGAKIQSINVSARKSVYDTEPSSSHSAKSDTYSNLKQIQQLRRLKYDSDDSDDNELEAYKEISDLGTNKSSVVTKLPKKRPNIKVNVKVKTNDPNTDMTASERTHRSTEKAQNSLKRNNIDEEMKECEQKVTKKFKGSFLDSLF